uniref:BED-type domain-containing protein n=1 Tax=Gadus morhua TaxID=8049 RepID=A0A8C5AM76_GADMO
MAEGSEDRGGHQTLPHPWPYLEEVFEIVGSKNDSWCMRCKLCQPKNHVLSAFKNSPSNLKKHIERKHPNHLGRYKTLTANSQKRKPGADAAADEGPPPKQAKLWETRRVSQASVDKEVLHFIIQGLHPPNLVEQQGFVDLVHHLQPNINVMSRNTVVNKVEKVALEMKINLKTCGIEFIATTTDCWTAYRRGFLGVTAHWIDPQTMKRCCAALACKQLKGSHSFSALASALNEIHTEFNIRDKITRTTTDNGSNFLKAFRLYGQTNENINNPAPTAASGEEDDDGGEDENNEDQDSVEFVEAGAILDEDDCLEYQLPKHHRCACHLLNLVATVDVEEANVSTVYKRVSRSTFSKCWSL